VALLSGPQDGPFTTLQLSDVFAAAPDAAESVVFGSTGYQQIKRVLDLVVCLVALVTIAPLLLIIALAIVIDSRGPVLYRQTRIGLHGRQFAMLKFRTMRPERRLGDRGLQTGEMDRRRRHKSIGDPRVTRVGRLLRRTCFDELPQLWNVLRGEMSLVGPRPELPSIVARYEPWQHVRHVVAPGITGWWQVNRAADQLMHEATELDIYYVRNHSLGLDLKIIARTFGAVIDGRGAY
jgi:lipopolysaccharide/colanic/teichoic acid biosynthesis glycosyltransferase